MKTKAEMEKQIKALFELEREKNNQIYNLKEENKKLKYDVDCFNNHKKTLVSQCNQRAIKIRQILNIISGEAKPESKYEVIRDMFLIELNELSREMNEDEGVRVGRLDIEIYKNVTKDSWAQGKYLVHGYDDVLWTDDLDSAIQFFKDSILELQK